MANTLAGRKPIPARGPSPGARVAGDGSQEGIHKATSCCLNPTYA